MELIERPNLRAVHYLNSIKYEDFSADCKANALRTGDKPPKKEDIKVWFSQLRKFCNTTLKTKGHTKRIYTHSANTPAGLGGRLFCGNSLQGIWGVYRGLLMRGIATDIDMVNAHPTIARYACKRHSIDCPHLAYYNENRDRCLEEFPNRNMGKKTYLVATNTDKRSRDTKLPQNFRNYDKEMKTIQKALVELPDYQQLYDTIPEYKQSHNYNGCAINRVLCYYENIILGHAIHYVNTLGIEIGVLMFDGMMIYGDHYANKDLLKGITDYVESQMTGLNMQWAYKECDKSMQIPSDFDETDYEELRPLRFATDDRHAAELIISSLDDCIRVDISGRLYFRKDHIWVCSLDDVRTFLLNFILESDICRANEEDKYVPYSQNMKTARSIMDCVINKLTSGQRLDMTDLFHRTTRGRICFMDGVLDIKQKKFYKWDDVNFEFYSCVCVPRNFADYNPNTEANRKIIAKIRDEVFGPLYNEKIADALNFFARGIAGHVGDKMWMSHTTNRHGGKSTTNKAFEGAFGKQYVKTLSLDNISYSRLRAENKTSMSKYWLLEYEFARLAISQEVPNPSEGVKVDAGVWKKMTSGCDTFLARRPFDRQDTEFTTDATFAIFGNYQIVSDSPDIWDTCLSIHSHNTYHTEAEIADKKANNAHEREMQYIHLRDPTLIEKFESDDNWKNAVVWMLVEAYTDTPVAPTRLDKDDEDDVSICRLILENYNITDNPNDVVLCSDLHEMIKAPKKNVCRELEKLAVRKTKSVKRDSTRNKYVYVGIAVKPSEMVDEI